MTAPRKIDSTRAPLFPDSAFDLVVIGASAGGVFALKQLITALPASFPAPLAIVQHLPASRSLLHEVFGLRARMPVRFAEAGDRLRAGTVVVAPPDRHLLIGADRRFDVVAGERINYVRPSADPLFETASRAFGPRLLGVVLTGTGRDGARGAAAVKEAGGVMIVEDPAQAHSPGMPEAALRAADADLVLPLDAIGRAILSLTAIPGARAWLGVPRRAERMSPPN